MLPITVDFLYQLTRLEYVNTAEKKNVLSIVDHTNMCTVQLTSITVEQSGSCPEILLMVLYSKVLLYKLCTHYPLMIAAKQVLCTEKKIMIIVK